MRVPRHIGFVNHESQINHLPSARPSPRPETAQSARKTLTIWGFACISRCHSAVLTVMFSISGTDSGKQTKRVLPDTDFIRLLLLLESMEMYPVLQRATI
jgi:hypothetical protein